MTDHKPHEDAIREGDPPHFSADRVREDGAMADARAKLPIGRPRRVAGIALLGVGLTVIGRVAWLGEFYREGFRDVEWIRFYGLLWIGSLLCLVGYWLAYRSRVAMWTFLLSVAMPILTALAWDLLRIL